jgi:hypothetical protein
MNDVLHIIISCFVIIAGIVALIYVLSIVQMRAWFKELNKQIDKKFKTKEEDEREEDKQL